MRYKIDKINIILNAFFKLPINVVFEEKQEILKNLYKNIIKYEDINVFKLIFIYYIILIKMDDDFKK